MFNIKSERSTARARGHLKSAESYDQDQEWESRDFSVDKAKTALQMGMIEEAQRTSDAAEVRAAAALLVIDPELLEIPEDTFNAMVAKINSWAKRWAVLEEGGQLG